MHYLIDKGISVLEFIDLGSQKPRFCSCSCYLLVVLSLARQSSTVISVFSISVVVHLINHVRLFMIPWNTAQQASLCFTIPELAQTHVHQVGDAIHTILSSVVPFSSCLQSFPASGSSLMNQIFASSGQSIRASPSSISLLMNIQDLFPLGLTGLISLQSKGLSRVFSNNNKKKSLLQNHSSKASIHWHSAFFMVQLTSIHDYWKNYNFD